MIKPSENTTFLCINPKSLNSTALHSLFQTSFYFIQTMVSLSATPIITENAIQVFQTVMVATHPYTFIPGFSIPTGTVEDELETEDDRHEPHLIFPMAIPHAYQIPLFNFLFLVRGYTVTFWTIFCLSWFSAQWVPYLWVIIWKIIHLILLEIPRTTPMPPRWLILYRNLAKLLTSSATFYPRTNNPVPVFLKIWWSFAKTLKTRLDSMLPSLSMKQKVLS